MIENIIKRLTLTLTLSVQKSGVWYKWPNFEFLKLYSWYKVKNKASYNYTVPQPNTILASLN